MADGSAVAVVGGAGLNAALESGRAGEFRIAAIVVPQPLTDPRQPELFDSGYPAWCDTLIAAREPRVPLVIGSLAEAAPGNSFRHDDTFRFAIDSLRKIRFDAERCGVRLAVQARAELGFSVGDMRELIDEANSYWVGMEVEASGPDLVADVADSLAVLTHRVIAVRLRNAAANAIEDMRCVMESLQLDAPLIIDAPQANPPTR